MTERKDGGQNKKISFTLDESGEIVEKSECKEVPRL